MSKGIGAAFACALCMSLGLATLFVGTFPLFLQPVSREFGWDAGIYPQAVLASAAAAALAGPFVGQLMDRFGVRPIMLMGLVGWAGSLLGLSLLNGSRIQLLSISAAMGIFSVGCGPIALTKVVAGWFDRHRGVALGIVLSAAPAITTAIMIVAMNALLTAHGWRFSYRALAASVVCLCLPVALLLVREPPLCAGAGQPNAEHGGYGLPVWQALRNREFWKVMLMTGLVCGVVQSLIAHFVAFSAEHGVSPTSAAVALSAFSLAGPAGPLLAGALADRVSSPKPVVIFYGLPLLGFTALVLMGRSAAIPAMILVGVGFQTATGMLPYLLTRYFGVRYASQLFGVGVGIVMLSMGVAPVILGFIRDRLQSFTPTIPVLVTLLTGAFVIGLALRKYETI